jgi:hypothetical protein
LPVKINQLFFVDPEGGSVGDNMMGYREKEVLIMIEFQ